MKGAEHKSHIFDGGLVTGGAAYTMLAESLPIVIGLLTAGLFIMRIIIAVQEYKLNKKKLDEG